jgi:hypothetical protein
MKKLLIMVATLFPLVAPAQGLEVGQFVTFDHEEVMCRQANDVMDARHVESTMGRRYMEAWLQRSHGQSHSYNVCIKSMVGQRWRVLTKQPDGKYTLFCLQLSGHRGDPTYCNWAYMEDDGE